MAGSEYVERLAQILLQHSIIARITEEMMRQAHDDLRLHATGAYHQWSMSASCLLEALIPWLDQTPQRLVWFDAEMDATTYEDLMRAFAAATGGEWLPEPMTSDVSQDQNTGDFQFTIDFAMHGAAIHEEWASTSLGWVAPGFLTVIERIAATYLSGEFVEIPMHDQTMLFAYMPRLCVQELQALIGQLEQEYPDFMTLAHTL